MYKRFGEFEPESREGATMPPTETKHFKQPSKNMKEEEEEEEERRARERVREDGLTNGSGGERRAYVELLKLCCIAPSSAMGPAGAEVETPTSREIRPEYLVRTNGGGGGGGVVRAFDWLNDKLKERNRRRIQRTYFREKTEGGELYVRGRRVFAASMIKSRAEREREKRKALQRLENTRMAVEKRMREFWAGKLSKSEAPGRPVEDLRHGEP